ncbi:MAG: hypothetical protein KY433_09610, partial [Actinobacteria bacterium]|nr:hypothetical protein [Actinomycetota bacterium]
AVFLATLLATIIGAGIYIRRLRRRTSQPGDPPLAGSMARAGQIAASGRSDPEEAVGPRHEPIGMTEKH